MTGQGHTRMDQIKSSRPGVALNVNKEYRTANGHLVRGLNFQYTMKQLHSGMVIDTADRKRIIHGQIKLHSKETGTQEWIDHFWFDDGRHFFFSKLNLVPHTIKVIPPPTLF